MGEEAAEDAYDRTEECSFTSFVGYEYTGTPGISNYHRNVVFRGSEVPGLPVSYVDAPTDSLLWQGLDAVCGEGTARPGCDYLTIPHNSNLANGRMAPYRGLAGTLEARREYAAKRLEREPIIEIFQHKGGSECINGLSTVFAEPDELCDVEAVRVMGREETVQSLLQSELTEVTEECPEGENGNQGMLGAGCVDRTRRRPGGGDGDRPQSGQARHHRVDRHAYGDAGGGGRRGLARRGVRGADARGAPSAGSPDQRHRRQSRRLGRRLGGRELPGRDLRGDGAAGGVRHLGSADPSAVLRRLGLLGEPL
ncbi:MAG: DUF3604 domain-containing protein [Acidobacteria bacterium]|nr:DUF3604 domain-containing protein [Acidobacteriota bacterium]